jgi:hypothetical protein
MKNLFFLIYDEQIFSQTLSFHFLLEDLLSDCTFSGHEVLHAFFEQAIKANEAPKKNTYRANFHLSYKFTSSCLLTSH